MQKDKEKLWEENVNEAKVLVTARFQNQMKIAGLALEVCEITHGGVHARDLYTLTRFAEEIKVNVNTLSNWCAIHKKVYSVARAELRQKASFTQMQIAAHTTPPNATPLEINKRLDKLVNSNDVDIKVAKYLRTLRGLATNMANERIVNKVSSEILEEILYYTESISEDISRRDGKKLKAKNNFLAARHEHRNLRINAVLAGQTGYVEAEFGRVKITSQDQKVLDHLRVNKDKRLWSPSELGRSIGFNMEGSGNKDKLKSLRSLQKLEALDLVKKNKHGHYFLVNSAK